MTVMEVWFGSGDLEVKARFEGVKAEGGMKRFGRLNGLFLVWGQGVSDGLARYTACACSSFV